MKGFAIALKIPNLQSPVTVIPFIIRLHQVMK